MRKISKKQSKINRELRAIKQELAEHPYCVICKGHAHDLAHILPRSTYPEYITEKWNLVLMCRDCHVEFDSSREFRRKSGLIDRVPENGLKHF